MNGQSATLGADDETCPECGSRLETHKDAEIVCTVCGLVIREIHEMPTNSSFTQSPEVGDKPELSRPTFTPRTPINASLERTEDDLLWVIPPAKKKQKTAEERKITAKAIVSEFEEKLDIVEKLQHEIEELEDEDPFSPEINDLRDRLLDAEADFEFSRKESKSFSTKGGFGEDSTPQNLEEMLTNTQARNWLGLYNHEDEGDLEPDSKSVLVELNKLGHGVRSWSAWKDGQGIRHFGFVDNIFWQNGVPERSLVDEKGMTRKVPRRERRGLEVFIELVGRRDAFWFFDDFSRITRMNPARINWILEQDLPIARSVQGSLISMSRRDWHSSQSVSEFVLRCARRCKTEPMGIEEVTISEIPLPPEELWRKLGMGPKGEGVTKPPRFWIEIWDKSAPIVQEEREEARSSYAKWEYYNFSEEEEDSEEPDSSHGTDWYEQFMSEPQQEADPERWGFVRRHPAPIMLRHIPIAYFIAQQFFSRRGPGFRAAAATMLSLIEKDLEWCSATVEEMDAWWDSVWMDNPDDTKSVTELRNHT